MNLTLWITSGLLTVVALTGGISKTLVSKDKLAHVSGERRLAGSPTRGLCALGCNGGVDGTRTRGLRRDRPAF